MTDIPELTEARLRRAIPARVRKRIMQGRFESGEDIAALRNFIALTQAEFAKAIAISVHTLRAAGRRDGGVFDHALDYCANSQSRC